jgi:hypothetical protein
VCVPKDSDNDGITDQLDSDNIGIADNIEAQSNTAVAATNSDTNKTVSTTLTIRDWHHVDTDSDGVPDF